MPAIVSQTYRMVPVGDLEPHPHNPHKGDVDVITESIAKNGFYGTVLVQKSRMRIIAGEHRWRGAKANGLEQVPALVIDVDDDIATRIMLADNRTAEFGAYDDQVLAELLRGLDDLDGTGWHDDDLNDLLANLDSGIEIVEDSPAERRPAVAAAGDDDEQERPRARPRIDLDDEDDLDDDGGDDGHEDDVPPPRPKAGLTADLLLTLTAAEHDEVNALLGRIRARDGAASTTQIVLAALRAYAD
ncbi:ParB/RepB/Spo0J family partition protein [Nonomuraea sp. NPDC049152]|uniref:ParB/RepB/Spo0J family partition protein n=1 Tax=Nonomuraea sp. NPDC049152 TaxID=3154350 RepID=UPI0033C477D4